MNLTVSAALVFNQYVNPIALDKLNWKYYIVFCVFLAFEVVYIYFFAIETRGPNGPLPLEEISALFEGKAYYGFQKRPQFNPPADEEYLPEKEASDNHHVEKSEL